jgi:small subunit ribosomal protein S16
MAVVLRLSRAGTHKAPFYHVVATDSRSARDGRYIEDVGLYDPTKTPERIELKTDRIEHWLKSGAKPSQTVAMILKRAQKTAPAAAEKKA